MALNPATRVNEQNHEALDIAVEVGVRRHVLPPIGSRFVGGIAKLHFGRCRTFAQGQDFEFLRIENPAGCARLARHTEQGWLE